MRNVHEAKILLLALMVMTSLRPVWAQGEPNRSGIIVTDPKPWSYIVTAGQFWIPSQPQVNEAEKAISIYFEGPKPQVRLHCGLNRYLRQYVGSQMEGHRCIRCFFHVSEGKEAVSAAPLLICDGGDSVFEIDYDLESRTCFGFQPNGYA